MHNILILRWKRGESVRTEFPRHIEDRLKTEFALPIRKLRDRKRRWRDGLRARSRQHCCAAALK
jgi:hypothetical protein